MLVLSPKDMQEAKKSIKDKSIKAKDVKNLPPIVKLCEPTTHPPMVDVHSLLDFNARDIPKGKPPDQCLNELDNLLLPPFLNIRCIISFTKSNLVNFDH